MTLEEAIEKLRTAISYQGWPELTELNQAQQLGIEALKMWGQVRENGRWPASTRLVGETFIPESIGKLPSDEE